MIRFLTGPDLGVPHNEDYMLVETVNPRVVFAYSQKGQAITAHFACSRENLRALKPAINEFCQWVFSAYGWCKMILACTEYPSIGRVVQKCGFSYVGEFPECDVYMLARGSE